MIIWLEKFTVCIKKVYYHENHLEEKKAWLQKSFISQAKLDYEMTSFFPTSVHIDQRVRLKQNYSLQKVQQKSVPYLGFYQDLTIQHKCHLFLWTILE